jgi:hypothetical protein
MPIGEREVNVNLCGGHYTSMAEQKKPQLSSPDREVVGEHSDGNAVLVHFGDIPGELRGSSFPVEYSPCPIYVREITQMLWLSNSFTWIPQKAHQNTTAFPRNWL